MTLTPAGYVTSRGVGQYATGEGHLAILHRLHRPDGTRRAVLACHGRGGDHLDLLYEPTEELGRAGYAVIGGDYGGETSWGNDTSISRLGDGVEYAQGTASGEFGCAEDGVLLYAGSMGALVALNWARQNLESVLAVALVAPILDLDAFRDSDLGGFQTEIDTAYGDNTAFEAALSTHSPAEYADELTGLPIRIWYSTSDSLALPDAVTAFASTSGADAVSVGAVDHHEVVPPAGEWSAFFSQYA